LQPSEVSVDLQARLEAERDEADEIKFPSELLQVHDHHDLAGVIAGELCGLEDERGLDRNTEAFKKHQRVPRYLADVSKRDQTQTIFGRTYGSPFGIAPTGVAGLFRRGADMMLARAAVEADIPLYPHPAWVFEYVRQGACR
jgi:FMN-dependent dehydrogenase